MVQSMRSQTSIFFCVENIDENKDRSRETVKGPLQNPDELRWESDPVEIL